MILNYFYSLRVLFQRLLLVLALLLLLKVCFYLYNSSHFTEISFRDLLLHLFWGLRFDLSIIFLLNSLFILLSILPFPFVFNKVYQKLLFGLFIFCNGLLYLIECSDIIYFQFSQKRVTADVLTLIGNQHDFVNLLPVFLLDYWYFIILWVACIYVTVVFYKPLVLEYHHEKNKWTSYLKKSVVFIFLLGLCILIVRGGTQLKPIQNSFAVDYTLPEFTPLVLNSTFSLSHSFNKGRLTKFNFFSDSSLLKVYNPIKKPVNEIPFKNKNVVIIVLESFSAEYTSLGGRISYSPFLDSLMTHSIVFKNAYSNGKRSNEGIPAIVSGMPTWMADPYLSSAYSTNRINSIASFLKVKGYETAFFHGADNGSMYFDKFMKTAGFDAYYGRDEFNDDSKYDQNWGIWDEYFFKFYTQKMKQMQEPFCTVFFSLSSHHPFNVPSEYKNKFSKGSLPIHQVLGYTDWALKSFFQDAAKMPWYNNTLFVITADHTGPSNDSFYLNPLGNYRIPLLLFDPSENSGKSIQTVTQQIDIMPTILEYLNYPEPYFAFGNNALDINKKSFALNYLNSTYQFIADDYFIQFDGAKTLGMYYLPTDSLLKTNLLNSQSPKKMEIENKLKAVIQTYNDRLLSNQTSIALHK